MEENEVKGRKVAIDIVKANIFAVAIMVVAAIVFLVPFFWIWAGKKPIGELLGGIGNWGTAFILMFVGIVVHELIHGLTWACYAKNGWMCTSKVFAWLLGIFGFCLFVTFMTIALLIAGNLQFRVY